MTDGANGIAPRPRLSFAIQAVQDAREALASVETYSLRELLERSPGLYPSLYDELGTTIHHFVSAYGSIDALALEAVAVAPTTTNPPDSLADMYFRMSEDLREACWVRDQVLEENDALRRELRMWKLSAARDWGTLPYPDLDGDDFDDLERQP